MQNLVFITWPRVAVFQDPGQSRWSRQRLNTSVRIGPTGRDSFHGNIYYITKVFFRTFSLPCSGGICESSDLPSCSQPLKWEEPEVIFHDCNETVVHGETLLCGVNGTKGVRLRSEVGGGLVEEVNIVACQDCWKSTTRSSKNRQKYESEKG